MSEPTIVLVVVCLYLYIIATLIIVNFGYLGRVYRSRWLKYNWQVAIVMPLATLLLVPIYVVIRGRSIIQWFFKRKGS